MSGPVDWSKSSTEGAGTGSSGEDRYDPQPHYGEQSGGAQPYDARSYAQSYGEQSYGEQSYGNPAANQPQPGGYQYPPVPPSNAGWAVAAVIFFWPLAFVAFTASADVTRFWLMGEYDRAQQASDRAKRLGKIALGVAVGLIVLYILFIIVLIAATAASTS